MVTETHGLIHTSDDRVSTSRPHIFTVLKFRKARSCLHSTECLHRFHNFTAPLRLPATIHIRPRCVQPKYGVVAVHRGRFQREHCGITIPGVRLGHLQREHSGIAVPHGGGVQRECRVAVGRVHNGSLDNPGLGFASLEH